MAQSRPSGTANFLKSEFSALSKSLGSIATLAFSMIAVAVTTVYISFRHTKHEDEGGHDNDGFECKRHLTFLDDSPDSIVSACLQEEDDIGDIPILKTNFSDSCNLLNSSLNDSWEEAPTTTTMDEESDEDTKITKPFNVVSNGTVRSFYYSAPKTKKFLGDNIVVLDKEAETRRKIPRDEEKTKQFRGDVKRLGLALDKLSVLLPLEQHQEKVSMRYAKTIVQDAPTPGTSLAKNDTKCEPDIFMKMENISPKSWNLCMTPARPENNPHAGPVLSFENIRKLYFSPTAPESPSENRDVVEDGPIEHIALNSPRTSSTKRFHLSSDDCIPQMNLDGYTPGSKQPSSILSPFKAAPLPHRFPQQRREGDQNIPKMAKSEGVPISRQTSTVISKQHVIEDVQRSYSSFEEYMSKRKIKGKRVLKELAIPELTSHTPAKPAERTISSKLPSQRKSSPIVGIRLQRDSFGATVINRLR